MPCPRASVRHSAAMNDGTLSCSPTTCRHSRLASEAGAMEEAVAVEEAVAAPALALAPAPAPALGTPMTHSPR